MKGRLIWWSHRDKCLLLEVQHLKFKNPYIKRRAENVYPKEQLLFNKVNGLSCVFSEHNTLRGIKRIYDSTNE